MDLSVLRRSEDNLEATELQAKEPKLSYSIASLLQTVQRAKAAPVLEREEKNEESDEESEISVDSNHDTSEDDRLAVSKEEEDPEEQQSPPLLDLRLGVPPHLLPPGLGLPLQGLLPPGWPGLALLQHSAINNQHRHHPGNLQPRSSQGNKCGAMKAVK